MDPNSSLGYGDYDGVWCAMHTATTTDASLTGGARRLSSVSCPDGCCTAVNELFKFVHKTWNVWLRAPVLRLLSAVCGVTSVLILWSELVMGSELHSPLGELMSAYNSSSSDPVLVQGISFLLLTYMSICTYWTLFRINIGAAFRLQGPQLSPPAALIFNAEYFSRLQFSLGYNFLLVLNAPR